jgi:small subunit ribosomal protein S17
MRTIKGIVTSNKMEKTIVVSVDTYKSDPKYKKRYKVTNKFHAHDEKNSSNIGDMVTIKESRPLSKLKRWELVTD